MSMKLLAALAESLSNGRICHAINVEVHPAGFNGAKLKSASLPENLRT